MHTLKTWAMCVAGVVTLNGGMVLAQPVVTGPAPAFTCTLRHEPLPDGGVPPAFDAQAWAQPGLRGGVTASIIIENPTGPIAPYVSAIQSNLGAAFARWAQFLDGTANIEILVRLAAIPTANARSETTVFVGSENGINIFEQGAAGEVRTGVDPNGATVDAVIQIGSSYIVNELWFDPDPTQRTAPVPNNRVDAVSVFLHELGHVFSFNGWRNGTTGTLPGNFMSPYDRETVFSGDFFFQGPLASELYGSDVPLTFGNIMHVGNAAPRPGADLIPELMNGVVFFYGQRYDVPGLTLRISRDVGVSMVPEEPGCDSLDFNNDSSVFDPQDIEAFLSVYSEGPCVPASAVCNDIDFNNDGSVFDPCDVASLLVQYGEGPCTPCG